MSTEFTKKELNLMKKALFRAELMRIGITEEMLDKGYIPTEKELNEILNNLTKAGESKNSQSI